MKSDQRKDFRTSVILSEDQHSKLNALAAENDVSVAWLIRQAITRLLEEERGSGVGIRQPKRSGRK